MGSHDWKLIVLAAISCIARSCSTRDFAATLPTCSIDIQAQASSTSLWTSSSLTLRFSGISASLVFLLHAFQ